MNNEFILSLIGENLHYVIFETDNVYIITNHKIGTRFLHRWSEGANLKYNDYCYIEPDQFCVDKPEDKSDNFYKIHQNLPLGKDILLLYRNPVEKTITGLIEDFIQSCLRLGQKEEFDKTYNLVKNNHFKKLIKQIAPDEAFEDYALKDKESKYHHLQFIIENDFVYDTDIRVSDFISDWFLAYVKVRMREFRISERHSKFWCFPAYYLVKEHLDNAPQNFYLFDLDNKNISLQDFLNTYHENSGYGPESDSNSKIKKMVKKQLMRSSIFPNLCNRLATEMTCYNKLVKHPNNVINSEVEYQYPPPEEK